MRSGREGGGGGGSGCSVSVGVEDDGLLEDTRDTDDPELTEYCIITNLLLTSNLVFQADPVRFLYCYPKKIQTKISGVKVAKREREQLREM